MYGRTYAGGATTWPWPTEDYELTSDAFDVIPGQIDLSLDGSSLDASLTAPSWGYRLVHIEGSSQGSNPIDDGEVTYLLADGSSETDTTAGTNASGSTTFEIDIPEEAISIIVTDRYGNIGQLDL